MNDVSNSEVSLFVSHQVVIQFTVQPPLFRFNESIFGEDHLAVMVNFHSVSLTESGCK